MRTSRLISVLAVAAVILGTSAALLHAGDNTAQAAEPTTFNLLGVTVEMHTMGVLPTALLCVAVLLSVVSVRRWNLAAPKGETQK